MEGQSNLVLENTLQVHSAYQVNLDMYGHREYEIPINFETDHSGFSRQIDVLLQAIQSELMQCTHLH